MKYQTIDCSVNDHILTIELNRPNYLNAFTELMGKEIIKVIQNANDNDDVKLIIFTGKGKAFCAGMDLSSSGNVFKLNENLKPSLNDLNNRLNEPEIDNGVRDLGGKLVLTIFECKKPIIAAINGAAVGVGATMTLAMDIRIASENAKIGFVFSKVGVVTEACSSWFLPRIVGISKALEWTYSAEMISTNEAKKYNLVNEVVPTNELLKKTNSIAKKIISNRSLVSIALIRQMMYRNSALTHPLEAHKIESLGMFYTSLSDGKEGVSAFKEKRSPKFDSKVSEMPEFYPWWN